MLFFCPHSEQLFGPIEFSRRDLAALNIMRGRETGLPDYNSVRRAYGLGPVYNVSEINPQLASQRPLLFTELQRRYESIDDIDTYIGGMLESTQGVPGPLFRAVIRDQFIRLRDGDRFWFENVDGNVFTRKEIDEIRSTTLADIIVASTRIDRSSLGVNVFFHRRGDPCPQPGQLRAVDLEPCVEMASKDFFKGNEVAYIYTCILVASVPVFTSLAAYFTLKRSRRQRRRAENARLLAMASSANSNGNGTCLSW